MKRILIGSKKSSGADLNKIYKKTFEKEIKKTVENTKDDEITKSDIKDLKEYLCDYYELDKKIFDITVK